MKKIEILYFSGAGQGKKLSNEIKKHLFDYEVKERDITGWYERENFPSTVVTEQMILIFPVYAGDVPKSLQSFLERIHPENDTKVIVFALWGNAHKGKALKHAVEILTRSEFSINGAAELVTKHSLLEKELPIQYIFSDEVFRYVSERLENNNVVVQNISEWKDSHLQRLLCKFEEGSVPRVVTSMHFQKDKCVSCNKCIQKCPCNAINEQYIINEKKCIRCMSCISNCSAKARSMELHKIGEAALNHHMKNKKSDKFY